VSVVDPPSEVWVHPVVRIGRSQIAGRGLFAVDDLAAGTVVLRLGGRLVGTHELKALLEVARADTGAGYVESITVYVDRHLVLSSGTRAHWCNHSCDPNLWHVGLYEIAARRPVSAGDELTVDYGTHSGAEGFRMQCACGSPECRREITSDDWRRPDLRARYRGHWTPALQ
jgi:SET domain-containing protein